VPRDGLRWLNYPFGEPKRWMSKVSREAKFGVRMAVLGPAAVATNWFAKYVDTQALVLPIRPRLKFLGMAPNPKTGKVDPFIKDLALFVYAPDVAPGFECWRWEPVRPRKGKAGTEVAA
jgi:hypothetical protein